MEWLNAKAVCLDKVNITGGFWRQKQDLMRNVTVKAIYDRFTETGRLDALRADWKEGQPNKPHIFWESDVAKWIESAAYLLAKQRDPQLEALVDECVALMEKYQQADGYLNVYYTVVKPGERFTNFADHELYCAGHLVEAAVAYAQATGKEALLRLVCRYVALIDRIFRVEHSASFDTPGHEEIELALFRLYEYTDDVQYRTLAEYFVEQRGVSKKDALLGGPYLAYRQAHLPVREQLTAEGHSVRATYLYCAMADLAYANQDERLFAACDTLFDNMVRRRMYITGGLGSTHKAESFSYDYHLPSDTAYAETCASIGLALFARRMWLIKADSKYADAAELAIYNTALSGISLSGDEFFYENPLAANPLDHTFQDSRVPVFQERLPIMVRPKVFGCSCCPPNIARLIASIGNFMYSVAGNTVYAHCFMDAEARLTTEDGLITIVQETSYPYSGTIRLSVTEGACGDMAIRVPAWSKRTSVTVDGRDITTNQDGGYLHLGAIAAGSIVHVQLDDATKLVHASAKVRDACGRLAVMRGPLVYCGEGHDNPYFLRDVRIPGDAIFETADIEIGSTTLTALRTIAKISDDDKDDYLYREGMPALRDAPVTLIPYHAWANRGISEMNVWFLQCFEG